MFYFLSYQGTRETNGATDQSLYKNVLIAPGLTDDRSEATLLNTFHPTLTDGTSIQSIDPVALNLLNAKLPDGKWLIPTPQADGRVTGTVPSTYNEDQFNTSLRKFLKQVGVTSQREIEKAVRDAIAAGRIKGHEKLNAKMVLTIDSIGLVHEINDPIELG